MWPTNRIGGCAQLAAHGRVPWVMSLIGASPSLRIAGGVCTRAGPLQCNEPQTAGGGRRWPAFAREAHLRRCLAGGCATYPCEPLIRVRWPVSQRRDIHDACPAEHGRGPPGLPGPRDSPAGSRRVAAAAADLRRTLCAGHGGGRWPLGAGHPPRGAGRPPGEQSPRVAHHRPRLRPDRGARGGAQHVVAPGRARVCPGPLPSRRSRDVRPIPRGRLPGDARRDHP